jgi:uncharacterized membrane protein YhfC
MDITFLAHLLNGLLMIGIPTGLAIYLTRRWKLSWRFWLVGAATFILSQVGHIPFNSLATNLLNQTGLVNLSASQRLLFNAAFLGLSAGLFEELSRYAVLRWWLKDARSWRKGVLFGAGHGGVEAIILGGLVLATFFQLVALRNTDLSSLYSGATLQQAQQQVSSYWSASWYQALLGALERVFAICAQVAMAVIVLQTFTRKQGFWVWLAVLYHAVIDATAVLGISYLCAYGTEALIGGFAILSLVIIFVLRQPEPAAPVELAGPEPTPAFVPKPVEESPDHLDNTRYQ